MVERHDIAVGHQSRDDHAVCQTVSRGSVVVVLTERPQEALRRGGHVATVIEEAAIESRTTRLRPGPHAPGQARRWIRWFEGYLTPEAAHDLQIVVSELVSNAVLHAGLSENDSIELAAQVRRDHLRVTVCDHGRGINPNLPSGPPDATILGGRGMYIIRRLTRRMLIEGGGGRVTFEIPLLVVG
jgi:anti-sigma regulatory factor (Ser/Thr protein kinase)